MHHQYNSQMVQGIKFLTKKSFNPTNLVNQKVVWEREQQQQQVQQQIQERNRILQQEKDEESIQVSRGGSTKVNFLYEPPPGWNTTTTETTTTTTSSTTTEQQQQQQQHPVVAPFTERQPGDDDAAAAFRQLLWSTTTTTNTNNESIKNVTQPSTVTHSSRGTVLQGTNYDPVADPSTTTNSNPTTTKAFPLTALEKAAGKKPQHGTRHSLSYDEQVQRFPMLAHAPRVAGIIGTTHTNNNNNNESTMTKSTENPTATSITFKPFGAQIRQVRCLSCGIWGHSKGDRECAKSGWDPFAIHTAAAAAPPSRHDQTTTMIPTTHDKHDATHQRGRQRDDDGDQHKSRKRQHKKVYW